jgi:hypothetical protein
VRVCFAAIALSFAVAGCGALHGGGADKPVAVTQAQLAVMVVPQDELGSSYAGLQADSSSGRTTSREFADGTPDPKDNGESTKRDGWRAGYELGYTDFRAVKREQGLYGVNTTVDLFSTESAARSKILQYVRFFENHRGKTIEGVKIERFATFDAVLGDDAWGLEYTIRAGGLRASETEVIFHRGPIVGSTELARADESAARVETLRLAKVLLSRVDRVLAGDLRAKPVSLEGVRPKISRARIARMTLAAGDLPASTKLKEEHLDKTNDDYIAYVRDFDLPARRLGASTVLGVRAETEVYADAANVLLVTKVLDGPEGQRFFQHVFRAALKKQGLEGQDVRTRPYRLADRQMRAVLLSFTSRGVRFDAVLVIVHRGRSVANLAVIGFAGKVHPQDVYALAVKARAKLA